MNHEKTTYQGKTSRFKNMYLNNLKDKNGINLNNSGLIFRPSIQQKFNKIMLNKN